MITLDDLKAECSVTHNADDALLERKLAAARDWISFYLGTGIDLETPAVEQAILSLAAHYYEHGSTLPDGFIGTLRSLREWTF